MTEDKRYEIYTKRIKELDKAIENLSKETKEPFSKDHRDLAKRAIENLKNHKKDLQDYIDEVDKNEAPED